MDRCLITLELLDKKTAAAGLFFPWDQVSDRKHNDIHGAPFYSRRVHY